MNYTDIHIEQAVLGAMMLESTQPHVGEAIDNTMSMWFSEQKHREIFVAIRSLRLENQLADLLSVHALVKDTVPAYDLAQITSKVSSSANIGYHIRVLQQLYTSRELFSLLSTESAQEIKDPFEVMARLKQQFDDLELTQEHKVSNIRELVATKTTELESRRKSEIKTIGKYSGYAKLDSFTGGIVPGDFIVVAGRPGMGKTSFAVNLGIEHAKHGGRVMMFSIEMPESQIADRVISSETGIINTKIRNANLDDYDMTRIKSIQLPEHFYVNDNSRLNIDQIGVVLKSARAKYGITLAVIDYLQLIKSESKNKNREQEVAYISGQCKRIAKDCGICVIGLAQLSREVEKRASKVPQLSDLRESGSIEQDADVVLFPYRPQYYEQQQQEIEPAELHIAKNRNGATGFIELRFQGATTQYLF